ncbi:hypothetical protein [Arcobacter sp. F2176]|uniref:hypothetical protein n=1 Tax=Arcobacter sp. F2176 TaxID=2044511 RepID=UPI00100AA65C|nr:hypothetical protein [Arcobacter sp. F2176]RXJ77511.1 hypothetical protein CRU95_16025 [Arcobacter sp. F2176]
MLDRNTTVTIRIAKNCMDFVKSFARKNDLSDSEQISTIVKTYEHLMPSHIRMEGFIYDNYKLKDKGEDLFAYETLYMLYTYLVKKNKKYEDYYNFAATLSKWIIVVHYIEGHIEITEDYDGGQFAKNAKEVARFLFGEKLECFEDLAANIIKKVLEAKNNDSIYSEKLVNYIYILCLSENKFEMLFHDEYIITREKILFRITKELKNNFKNNMYSRPYGSFQDLFGIKHTISKILVDYYQKPKNFLIINSISESFICDLLNNLHHLLSMSSVTPYSHTITAALKITHEVAKLEMYKTSYYNYFTNKLESEEIDLLSALQDDICNFEKKEIINNMIAENAARVPYQLLEQTLSNGCNFLDLSSVRQSINENFLDIFWPTLKYIVDEDELPLLLNPNKAIEYGGEKSFINDYGYFKGSYISHKDNPFSIKVYINNLRQLSCTLIYEKDDYTFDFELDIETINKLEVLINDNDNNSNVIATSSSGVSVKIELDKEVSFRGERFDIQINKNISNKLHEIIRKFKNSKDFDDILIVNRLHHGEL